MKDRNQEREEGGKEAAQNTGRQNKIQDNTKIGRKSRVNAYAIEKF